MPSDNPPKGITPTASPPKTAPPIASPPNPKMPTLTAPSAIVPTAMFPIANSTPYARSPMAIHPRATFIIGYGWTEPFLSACLAAFVYFEARDPGGPLQAIAFLLLPTLKQYVFAPTLLWLGTRPRRLVIRRIMSMI